MAQFYYSDKVSCQVCGECKERQEREEKTSFVLIVQNQVGKTEKFPLPHMAFTLLPLRISLFVILTEICYLSLMIFLVMMCVCFPHLQMILRYQQGVLQFNSVLTLSTWQQVPDATGYGLRPTKLPTSPQLQKPIESPIFTCPSDQLAIHQRFP